MNLSFVVISSNLNLKKKIVVYPDEDLELDLSSKRELREFRRCATKSWESPETYALA